MRTLIAGVGAAVVTTALAAAALAATPVHTAAAEGIHKIQHVVVIMQENRSFDTYFGTYPGATGIPAGVCVPTTLPGVCERPYYDGADINGGGPHSASNAVADIDKGKMDGFVIQSQESAKSCTDPNNPACANGGDGKDVMGYKDARVIPNYWTYAQNFVLQDHMFEPDASWSLISHLFLVSEWSAICKTKGNPMTCSSALQAPMLPPDYEPQLHKNNPIPDYPWTDLTYLLHKNNISWGYYIVPGEEPDCENPAMVSCTPSALTSRTPGIWNPLPYFDTVKADNQLGNIQSTDSFYAAAKAGTLPAVSWITPSSAVSEHAPAGTSAGQTYVTSLVNAVMASPDWSSTAIFLAWDDWGGFYDNVVPPVVDANGYGLRVPGLVISPYAKQGYIDHQTLSFDAYAKFIEDDFLDGQRLDPATDGRPDTRPDVRENAPILGDLASDFDFAQAPRPPMPLSIHPAPGPASTPPGL